MRLQHEVFIWEHLLGITTMGLTSGSTPNASCRMAPWVLQISAASQLERPHIKDPIHAKHSAGIFQVSRARFFQCKHKKDVEFVYCLRIRLNTSSSLEQTFQTLLQQLERKVTPSFLTDEGAAHLMHVWGVISDVDLQGAGLPHSSVWEGVQVLRRVDPPPHSLLLAGGVTNIHNLVLLWPITHHSSSWQ